MTKLLELIADKLQTVTADDEIMAMDYMAYYGIDESEASEYADSFLEECYHKINPTADEFNPLYDKYEPNFADEIPMANVKYEENLVWFQYRGQTVQKLRHQGE